MNCAERLRCDVDVDSCGPTPLWDVGSDPGAPLLRRNIDEKAAEKLFFVARASWPKMPPMVLFTEAETWPEQKSFGIQL